MTYNITVAAHQPNFMPNLGYFYKMAKVDKFILITNIQFEKFEGWQQRNKIQTPSGTSQWITIPVIGSQNQLIKDVKIDNIKNWQMKHRKTLQLLYAKTEGKSLLPEILDIYDQKWERLADINMAFIKLFHKYLQIPTELIIDEDVSGEKHNLLINLCKKYNASSYLSGAGAKSYMTDEYFEELEKENIQNHFIENPTSNHIHSTLHYLLKDGVESTRQKLLLTPQIQLTK